ncbi:MAG: FAD-dependent oxidoreductase [Shimia sp.]
MESIGIDLATYQRQPIQPAHLERMRAIGTHRIHPPGTHLVRMGEEQADFMYLEAGEVEAFDSATGQRYGDATLGPGQWFGEISFLHGGKAVLGSRTVKETKLLHIPREDMLELMRNIPELSDLIITVMAGRRRRIIETQKGGLILVGADVDRNVRRIAGFASRNKIPYRSIEIGSGEAHELSATCSIRPTEPAVILGKHEVIEDPTPRKVAQAFGYDLPLADREVHDVLVVGGGPAGVAAGVYAGAEGLSCLVLENMTIGGQAGTSSRIENYMGFPTGISGADLVWRGEVQAMKFGTRFAFPRTADSVRRDGALFEVTLGDGTVTCAKALIVATGVQYRKLPLDGLDRFEGAGIYYAATEVEARYCRESEVVIVGGGNSAGQAAMYLSRTAKHVHLLVRGDSLAASMSDYLSSRLEADPAITIHYRSELNALRGTDALEGVTIRDKGAGRDWDVATCGLFIMVGAAPNTAWLSDLVQVDERGFVLTGDAAGADSPFATSCPGIFAVGDVRSGSVKRVASAVGEGSVVISKVWDHVNAA